MNRNIPVGDMILQKHELKVQIIEAQLQKERLDKLIAEVQGGKTVIIRRKSGERIVIAGSTEMSAEIVTDVSPVKKVRQVPEYVPFREKYDSGRAWGVKGRFSYIPRSGCKRPAGDVIIVYK